MFFFIVRYGKYWTGGNPELESSWLGIRKGAVTFKSRREAQNRIAEAEIQDAEPEEY